jgi:Kef-type K+ transport system membrane component KefB
MDIATVLTDILVVLVAAKVAAEIAERIGIPAVVGEIVAGVLVGPSVLDLVGGHDEVLHTLGEIGVILLLFEVGMEMDLGELGKVGRASFLVAIVGVVAPMALGLGVIAALGEDFEVALFIGAALTATSVGITARVFGDLRALATTEARIVLGAAVADDVMGLVVLTVVVRIVTEGSVSVLSVVGIIAVAVAFLVVSAAVGLRVSGPLFRMVNHVSRSTGTLVAMALAFTLAFALLADAAKLAPIVGAFVAGIALSKSDQSERIRRELAPVGHLFIPSSRSASTQTSGPSPTSGCSASPLSSWWWQPSASSCRPSGPSGLPATRSSSAWACSRAARWASSSPPSGWPTACSTRSSTPPSSSSCW